MAEAEERKTPETKKKDEVYEKDLLSSLSKTHSVFAFIQAYGLDIVLYGLVFAAGRRKMELYWVIPPLAVLVVKDVWSMHRDRRKLAKVVETLRDDSKPLILADPNELPPWVHYPDVERCNWLNKLLWHFWPYICTVVAEVVETKVKPMVSQKVPGLKFRKISLGTVPPSLTGVKVYDRKVSSSHLMIDANVCYSGDCVCSISYRGIPAGVENVQLRGPARITLMVIEELPFIGGVEFSFLGHPVVEFMLTGIGSLGFTEETLRTVIDAVIGAYLVFPQKLTKTWAKMPETDIPEPTGVIRINVVEAKDLESKDMTFPFGKKNLSDAYAEVTYGSKTLWSRVIEDSAAPYWDMWCEFVKGKDDSVKIEVKDKDVNQDDTIGSLSIKVSELKKKGKLDSWLDIEGSKGKIHVRACFLEVSKDPSLAKPLPQDLSFLSTYVLVVLVKSAHNLVVPRSMKKPSAVVQLTVGNDTQQTAPVASNDNPVYGQLFNFFVNNPDFNKLKVKVVDSEESSEIGAFMYSLRKLLDRKDFELYDQHFPLLDSASESTVVVSMRLRAINNIIM